MTIQRSLAKWMEDNGFGVFGTSLFLGSIPQGAPIQSWRIIGGGGAPIIKNHTGEKVKAYIFNITYRNTNSEDVDTRMQELEELANSNACLSLDDYDTIEMEATGFQSDSDLDGEDRTLGSVEITVTVYQQ